MNKILLTLFLGIPVIPSLQAASYTFAFGDGLNADGSTVVTATSGIFQWDVGFNPGRQAIGQSGDPHHLIQESEVWDVTNQATISANGTWNPFWVGTDSGNQYRTVTTLNVNAPPAPVGEAYVITSVELWLEVSGSPSGSGTVSVYKGEEIASGAISSSSIGSIGISGLQGNRFYPISLDPSSVVLGSPFEVTLATNDPNSIIRFGSDYYQPGSVTGTNFSAPAPFIIINAETVTVVPEPSAILLLGLSGILFVRRKRA